MADEPGFLAEIFMRKVNREKSVPPTEKSKKDLHNEDENSTNQQEPDVQQLLRRIEQLEGERSQTPSNVTVQPSAGQKSMAVAYLLLLLFGQLGFHRFYFGDSWGFLQALAMIVGWIVFWFFHTIVGAMILGILLLWLLADALWIPEWIKSDDNDSKSRK